MSNTTTVSLARAFNHYLKQHKNMKKKKRIKYYSLLTSKKRNEKLIKIQTETVFEINRNYVPALKILVFVSVRVG